MPLTHYTDMTDETLNRLQFVNDAHRELVRLRQTLRDAEQALAVSKAGLNAALEFSRSIDPVELGFAFGVKNSN